MLFFSENHRTVLCEIMGRHGSDKGDYRGIGQHNYTRYYHQIFCNIRYSANSIFEFGIGSTRADIQHNMGPTGVPGASLRGWREYFPNANIFAADIDESILQPEYRILKFFCNQTDPSSIDALWRNANLNKILFDVIIEDGLHLFEVQKSFMQKSIYKLKPHGVYICEDVRDGDFPRWVEFLRSFASELPDRTFEIVKIFNRKNEWNSLIVIR